METDKCLHNYKNNLAAHICIAKNNFLRRKRIFLSVTISSKFNGKPPKMIMPAAPHSKSVLLNKPLSNPFLAKLNVDVVTKMMSPMMKLLSQRSELELEANLRVQRVLREMKEFSQASKYI